jgi:hypothetical protein
MANAAQLMGIKVYFLGSNGNLSEIYTSLRIYDWYEYGLLNPAPLTNSLDKYELSVENLHRIEKHIETSNKANSIFVYSQPSKNLSTREVFEIKSTARIYLLALSSYDEFFAAEEAGYMTDEFQISAVFESQTEWVEETIAWASDQENVMLIIRPHPREFSNRRESRTAPRDPRLLEILKKPPSFVRIDSPEFKFSIQDHFKEIDVMLISWSSTGIDALFQGIPVVSYDQQIARFPKEIVLSGKSRLEYIENLNRSLHLGKSGIYKQKAEKWFDYSQHIGSILLPGRLVYLGIFKKSRILTSIFYRLDSKLWKQLWWFESQILKTGNDGNRVRKMLLGKSSSLYDN